MKSTSLILVAILFLVPVEKAFAQTNDDQKTLRVFIFAGQSNMVGIGQVTGGGVRWGTEFIKPILSQYTGDFDPTKNYDELKPILTKPLDQFGGVEPTPYPKGGTRIVRGTLKVKEAGVYELRPGYGGSTNNIMEVNGKEQNLQQAILIVRIL